MLFRFGYKMRVGVYTPDKAGVYVDTLELAAEHAKEAFNHFDTHLHQLMIKNGDTPEAIFVTGQDFSAGLFDFQTLERKQ